MGALCAIACGAGEDSGDSPSGGFPSYPGDNGGDGNNGSTNGGGGNGGAGESDAGTLPPEVEETLSFKLPQAGATSVYVPNAVTDRVAIVNARNFAIETIRVGDAPTYTATVTGKDIALVINVGSQDVTTLRTKKGKTTATRVEIGHEANAIVISPDEAHAIVYFDASDTTQRAQSFQDVTVLDLTQEEPSAHGLSVGFRPRGIHYSADGKSAFVITEDGISIIDLTSLSKEATFARLVSVGDTLQDQKVTTDITITPDGKYALARKPDATVLRLVDLESGTIAPLDLTTLQKATADDAGAAPPLRPGKLEITDLDLAPSGDFAIAVARSHGALIRLPIPDAFTALDLISVTPVTDQLIGSVTIAPSGQLALAYTTATDLEGVVIVELENDQIAPRGARLRKAVRAVAISADGTRALVLHRPSTNVGTAQDEEARIDRSEGYSLLDTATGFVKLQLTDAAVSERGLTITPDAKRVFALLRDDRRGVSAVQIADLASFQVSTIDLVSPPSSIGLVPEAERVFVGQDRAGGMITFFDWNSGEIVKSVTGFELTSRIR
jgi:6-phosphogluconolactonase (cycloisomerase 2 family)